MPPGLRPNGSDVVFGTGVRAARAWTSPRCQTPRNSLLGAPRAGPTRAGLRGWVAAGTSVALTGALWHVSSDVTAMHRGRFAPSPTGRLHLGNAWAAVLGWLWARAESGEFLLRVE